MKKACLILGLAFSLLAWAACPAWPESPPSIRVYTGNWGSCPWFVKIQTDYGTTSIPIVGRQARPVAGPADPWTVHGSKIKDISVTRNNNPEGCKNSPPVTSCHYSRSDFIPAQNVQVSITYTNVFIWVDQVLIKQCP